MARVWFHPDFLNWYSIEEEREFCNNINLNLMILPYINTEEKLDLIQLMEGQMKTPLRKMIFCQYFKDFKLDYIDKIPITIQRFLSVVCPFI